MKKAFKILFFACRGRLCIEQHGRLLWFSLCYNSQSFPIKLHGLLLCISIMNGEWMPMELFWAFINAAYCSLFEFNYVLPFSITYKVVNYSHAPFQLNFDIWRCFRHSENFVNCSLYEFNHVFVLLYYTSDH